MASRFWVGGTGTWDSSTTTHWSATSGGAGGASVPGASDTVTFNALSGGGTVTLNFGGTITIQSLTLGAFTGTWDNSVNNNNITASGAGDGFSLAGSGTRTIRLGSATYTATIGNWSFDDATNATFTGSSATVVFPSQSGAFPVYWGSGQTIGTLSIGAMTGNGNFAIKGVNTFGNVTITAPCAIVFPATVTTTFSGAITWTGTSSNQIYLTTTSISGSATLAFAGGSTMQYCAFRGCTCTGSPVATNSFNLGNNAGITITAPGGGGLKYNNDMGGNLG